MFGLMVWCDVTKVLRCSSNLEISCLFLFVKSPFHPHCAIDRTEAQATAIYDAGMGFIRQHLILSRWSIHRGVVNWQLKPKLHQYDHIVYNCRLFRALACLVGFYWFGLDQVFKHG